MYLKCHVLGEWSRSGVVVRYMYSTHLCVMGLNTGLGECDMWIGFVVHLDQCR